MGCPRKNALLFAIIFLSDRWTEFIENCYTVT